MDKLSAKDISGKYDKYDGLLRKTTIESNINLAMNY